MRPVSIWGVLLLSGLVGADCECGYSVRAGGGGEPDGSTYVFTDLLESDFVHIDYVSEGPTAANRTGWSTQSFNTTAASARGRYGEAFVAAGVRANLIDDRTVWDGSGRDGSDAGLQLTVRSDVVDDMVLGAEIATARTDYLYGSYRVGMKISAVEGTCSAFFWYFNDTQEIDMEFLSSEFDRSNNSYPVNLVLQTAQSESAGYDASRTGTFVRAQLPFDPTADFHEYRFDFLPDRVVFFADGTPLASMAEVAAIPTRPGHLLVSHWSNGNPGWSRGPPPADALTSVRHVKAYYNSSDPARADDFADRCADPARPGAVCPVPEVHGGGADGQDQGGLGGGVTGYADAFNYFFMYEGNATVNQSTYNGADEKGGSRNAAPPGRGPGGSLAAVVWTVALGVAMWAGGF